MYQGCKSTLLATMISTSRAKHLMNSECIAYLAKVVEVPKATSRFENIPIVQELFDVFPLELSNMPPD